MRNPSPRTESASVWRIAQVAFTSVCSVMRFLWFIYIYLYKKRETYECIEFFCFFIHIVFAHVMVFAYNFRKRFRTLFLQTILMICCCMSVSHAVFVHWLHAFSSHVILTHCSHLQFPRSLRTWSKCQNSVLDYTAHPCVKLALCNPRGHFGICFRCTWIRCQNSLSDYAAHPCVKLR